VVGDHLSPAHPQKEVGAGRMLSAVRPFPCPGDVHVGMADRSGQLEVEVIQARGLIPKMGSKCIPGRWLRRDGNGAVPGHPQELL